MSMMQAAMAASQFGGGTYSAFISPENDAISGSLSSVVFDPVTVSVSNFVGPLTYSWAWSGTSAGTFGFSGSSTAATCNPSVTAVAAGNLASGTLTCTVTDTGAGGATRTPNGLWQYERF